MSLLTIDALTYNSLTNQTIARYLAAGHDIVYATYRAQELMANAFRIDDTTKADELDQKENGIYG